MISISESGMIFGPYPKEHCFHIEKSETYRRIQQKVKMVEFAVLRVSEGKPVQVRIVEAKSSSAHPGNAVDFDKFIHDIKEKWTNGLSMSLAACLKRHASAEGELSPEFKKLDLAAVEFRLVLVIKDHPKAWLQPLKDRLLKELHGAIKTWSLGAMPIAVLNEQGARDYVLIS